MSAPKISRMHQRVIDKSQDKVLEPLNIDPKMPENQFWNEAQDLYQRQLAGVDKIEGVIAELAEGVTQHPESMGFIDDPQRVVDDLRVISHDLQSQRQLLDRIHDTHKDRTGSTTTPEDHVAYLGVINQHTQAYEVFESVVIPTANRLAETIGAALQRVVPPVSAEQDPNVISDAVVTSEQTHG